MPLSVVAKPEARASVLSKFFKRLRDAFRESADDYPKALAIFLSGEGSPSAKASSTLPGKGHYERTREHCGKNLS